MRAVFQTMMVVAMLLTPTAGFGTTLSRHRPLVAPVRPLRVPAGILTSAASGLDKLSVGELKSLLQERGIDFRDCLEKRELVEKLELSSPSTASRGWRPANSFTESEERTVDTFKRVSPSVAFITTSKLSPAGFSLRPTEYPAGTGSGFIWDAEGHIVTNWHVIAGGGGSRSSGGEMPARVKVSLQGLKEPVDASVVGFEEDKDLAVLKIDRGVLGTQALPPVQVGTSSDLAVGQTCLAIGNPFGLDYTLTTGVVSALGREVSGAGGRPIQDCVQTDAAINPGNSGGPLLDSGGRLIGVNTAIYAPGGIGANVGIGFAIPVDTVRRVVNQIIRYGPGTRPTLGVNILDDALKRAIAKNLRRSLDGALVVEVVAGSPAEAAGLRPTRRSRLGETYLGDLIVAIDGAPVRENEDLLCAVEESEPGSTLVLTIMRGGDAKRVEQVRIKPAARKAVRVAGGIGGGRRYQAPITGVTGRR